MNEPCLIPNCVCKRDGSTGVRETDPASRIPGDDRIIGTLEDVGYDPAIFRDGAVSDYTLALLDHPAVVRHGKGMSSDDLASFTEALSSLAQGRVRGTGHEQYAEANGQQFERMTLDQLAEWMLEEAADVINYQSMSAIKILATIRAMRRG